jgi:hypothetical protein
MSGHCLYATSSTTEPPFVQQAFEKQNIQAKTRLLCPHLLPPRLVDHSDEASKDQQ